MGNTGLAPLPGLPEPRAHKPRPRRPRGNVSRGDKTASFVISLSWHFIILAVLAFAVHPFAPPREEPPVTVELIPPFPEPEPPPVEVRQTKPEPVDPLEILHPPKPVLSREQVVKQREVAQPKLVNEIHAPEPLPPAPTEVAKAPYPALSQPVQVQRRNAPSPNRLNTQIASPQFTPAPTEAAAPKAEAAPEAAAPVQVLTNSQVVQAPVEIKPAAHTPVGARNTALPANLPPPGGAQEAPGGGPPGGGGGGGAAATADTAPLDKPGLGYDAKGIRTGPHLLGCYTPEAYLTSAEKAACAQQAAEKGKKGLNLGINIDPAKQADYDRNRACHNYTITASPGTSNGASLDTSVKGLGYNPRLRDCGPGDR